jgi:hypothetical protein
LTNLPNTFAKEDIHACIQKFAPIKSLQLKYISEKKHKGMAIVYPES